MKIEYKKANATDAELLTMDAESYYLKGLVEFEAGNYTEAIRYFEQSNDIEEHFKSYERMYCCFLKTGDNTKAFECIEKAYLLNQKNDKTAFEYAEMLAKSGNTDASLKILSEITQRNPSYKKAAELAGSLKRKNS